MQTPRIALVGDYNPDVVAHQAIPLALKLGGADFQWIPSDAVGHAQATLAEFAGVWLVPASPYRSMDGAIAAVRFARESGRPFLGSCGGFQHALIEYARNVLGLPGANHAETAANDEPLVITPLTCGLVEKSQCLRALPGTILHHAYGADGIVEEYHCNYGVNPNYRAAFTSGGVTFSARDDAGDIRAFELPPERHPFFVGTLFQSERRALRGELPPIVREFCRAADRRRQAPSAER